MLVGRLRALARSEADGLPLWLEPCRRRAGELVADQRHGPRRGDGLRTLLPCVPARRLGRRDPGEGAWHRHDRSLRSRLNFGPQPGLAGPGRGPWIFRKSPAAAWFYWAAARWAQRFSRAGSRVAWRPRRSRFLSQTP